MIKAINLEQSNNNYVEIINELKSKFKMQLHLCKIKMRLKIKSKIKIKSLQLF